MTEAEAPAEAQGRGRPRPQDVVARDERVYKFLLENGPKTRTQIAEAMGFAEQKSLAYMSLFRLRRDGHVKRQESESGKSQLWEAIPKSE